MGYYDIPKRAPDPKIYAGQLSNLVVERRELSHQDSIDLRRRVPKWYEQYRGYRRAKAQPFRNQVHVPMVYATIESDVAVKASLISNQRPIVEFTPTGPEDAMSARKTTSLIDQQFVDCSFYAKQLDHLRAADICGTSVIQWFWNHEENTRQQRVPQQDPVSGQLVPQVITGTFVDFNGPDFEVIDILDFYPEPGKIKLGKMRWAMRRYWLDYDEIKRMSAQGIFDPQATADLSLTSLSDESSTYLEERRINPGALFTSQHTPERFDKYSKPVEIFEMWGLLPDELVPDDGFNNRLISIANNQVMLRNVPNPIWQNGLPFAAYSPIPDPYAFYGIGKVEPAEKLQAAASRFTSQKLDALDFALDPQFVYNRLANVDTRKLYSRPGGLTPVDGNPAEAIHPLSPDLRGFQTATMEIESLWRWVQIASGVLEDTIIGAQGSTADRQTAREFLGRAESSQRRLVFETLMAVDQFVVPLAEAFRALNSQFMDSPQIIRMIGQDAVIDSETGMPIPPDPFVTLEDVIRRFDMKAQATTSLIGKAAKQQNDVLMLQTIGQSPVAMIANWYGVARKIFQDFDWNPDELLLNPQQAMLRLQSMAQVMAANQQQEGQIQAPGAPANALPQPAGVPGAPGKLNSDILQQFLQPESSAASLKPSGGIMGTI